MLLDSGGAARTRRVGQRDCARYRIFLDMLARPSETAPSLAWRIFARPSLPDRLQCLDQHLPRPGERRCFADGTIILEVEQQEDCNAKEAGDDAHSDLRRNGGVFKEDEEQCDEEGYHTAGKRLNLGP